MNLIIDIGNTRAKVVVFDGNEPVAEMVTDHKLVGLSRFVRQHKPERAIVSNTARLGRMAMHRLTGRLPQVELQGETSEVEFNTPTAMRSGVIWGLRREIEEQIDHFRQKYPHLSVFLTGGDAKELGISKEFTIFADELLVPRGLNTILAHITKA